MRVAYATSEVCGLGHSVRGIALVKAGRRAGIEVRAFGPPKDAVPSGYEGTPDWAARVSAWKPDLLLGDLQWMSLNGLRLALGAPAWLLLRWMPANYLTAQRAARRHGWDRVISIEPAADGIIGITDRIAPIIDVSPLPVPSDGAELRAGYNTWWRAAWFGYRDRMRWHAGGSLERQARIDAGGAIEQNGADVLMEMIR
jgi:hypothetical protein